MNYSLENNDNQTIVCFSGHLQFEDHTEFKSLLDQNLAQNTQSLITFDLSNLEFIDSSGIGMILLAHETLRGNGKKLSLTSAQGQVKRVLDLTRIDQYLADLK